MLRRGLWQQSWEWRYGVDACKNWWSRKLLRISDKAKVTDKAIRSRTKTIQLSNRIRKMRLTRFVHVWLQVWGYVPPRSWHVPANNNFHLCLSLLAVSNHQCLWLYLSSSSWTYRSLALTTASVSDVLSYFFLWNFFNADLDTRAATVARRRSLIYSLT